MRPEARPWIALALALLLAGCGFQFRDAGQWPASLDAVQVRAAPQARDFALALRRALRDKGATLTEEAAAARLVIEVADASRARRITALSAAGTATEYEVVYEARVSARDSAGGIVLAAQTMQERRSYAYDPARALGLDQQEDRMIQIMERQVAEEVVRRLVMLLRKE